MIQKRTRLKKRDGFFIYKLYYPGEGSSLYRIVQYEKPNKMNFN